MSSTIRRVLAVGVIVVGGASGAALLARSAGAGVGSVREIRLVVAT
jgi:hypothetical protein